MDKKADMRAVALDTLVDMDRNHKLSHVAIGDTLMRYQYISRHDRAFYTHLCQGVTERRIYLDYMLDSVSKTPMHRCKPLIRSLLRMAAYQILFMQVPDAAACNEATILAKKRGFGNLSGFVNGVLRSLCRRKDTIPLPDRDLSKQRYLSVKYSMPEWIVELLTDQYGEDLCQRILESFLQVRPVTIRANLSRITAEELKRRLEEEGVRVEPAPYLPYAFHIYDYNYLGKIKAFREGLFTVQDVSSMLAVSVADIRPDDLILDLCAAPGGKTFHAADRLGENGKVISRDLTEYKTDFIKENNERMHYNQVKVEEWDACVLDKRLLGKADLVLADLPCSGLGIMGRKNDIKYHIDCSALEDLIRIQRRILSQAWKYLKAGGQMIYSTCTLFDGENIDNVRWIEENTPLRLVSIEDRLPVDLQGRTGEEGYIQLIPGRDLCDGFFFAKFINKG
ncbi:MAG: 16S rRNA (cytosine(967)-C(5))-methyltransferase RsmB [Eubacterium sp.]|nr:16S rRNA (cytosine(967)-C(5))-methyltransferase RsmB [Eubacterium sp.]